MKIERKHDEEIARRKGLTGRTIVSVIWLLISAAIAYFIIDLMLKSEEINFSYDAIYRTLSLPRSVPQIAVLAVLIVLITLIMQMFLWLGFAVASPEGRRRTGDPSLYSRNKDPFDDHGY